MEVYMLQPLTSTCELFGSPRRSRTTEPDLDELMRDPIAQALMAADGVDRSELDAIVAQVRNSLR